MRFPDRKIFTELVELLKSKEAHFTSNGHNAPAHYDMNRGQYEVDVADELPFDRDAVFFKFGTIEVVESKGVRSRRCQCPLTVTVVKDKYVDSRDGSDSQEEFLKILEYKFLVNEILDGYRGECFQEVRMENIESDYLNRPIHVEHLLYNITFTLHEASVT